MAEITTQARRLALKHNKEDVVSGWIYAVDIWTGDILALVATYAITQRTAEEVDQDGIAYLRISHGRMSYDMAQRFIDEKGQGW